MAAPKKNWSQRLSVLVLIGIPFTVSADRAPEQAVVYDRERGELSPGTQAPSVSAMVGAIDRASPNGLIAMLEYGERVECMECIPKLEAKLLGSNSPAVREIAAWWLRRRPFGYARAAVAMRRTVIEDADAVRRARAAEALGEFLDPGGVPMLTQAVQEDASSEVRLASVRALGRLNARAGHAALVAAFEDEEPEVRRAAIEQAMRVTFFHEHAAVISRLDDDAAEVRVRAAQLLGQLQVQAARDTLASMLAGDDSIPARQAAAWALGRIGGARTALLAAQADEQHARVLDAITVALRMTR